MKIALCVAHELFVSSESETLAGETYSLESRPIKIRILIGCMDSKLGETLHDYHTTLLTFSVTTIGSIQIAHHLMYAEEVLCVCVYVCVGVVSGPVVQCNTYTVVDVITAPCSEIRNF